MVSAGPVRVAVLDLFLGRVAKAFDGHFEVKRLAGERVIRIDGDGLVRDAGDEERNLSSLIIVREDLHAGRELCALGEETSRDFLRLADSRAVSLLGRDGRFDRGLREVANG